MGDEEKDAGGIADLGADEMEKTLPVELVSRGSGTSGIVSPVPVAEIEVGVHDREGCENGIAANDAASGTLWKESVDRGEELQIHLVSRLNGTLLDAHKALDKLELANCGVPEIMPVSDPLRGGIDAAGAMDSTWNHRRDDDGAARDALPASSNQLQVPGRVRKRSVDFWDMVRH